MQKLLFALSALLALTTAAVAEPLPMNEGQLGEIAAGVDISSPLMNVLSSNTTSTSTTVTDTSSVTHAIGQTLNGLSSNTVYATGVGSENVTANGSSTATIGSMISAPMSIP